MRSEYTRLWPLAGLLLLGCVPESLDEWARLPVEHDGGPVWNPDPRTSGLSSDGSVATVTDAAALIDAFTPPSDDASVLPVVDATNTLPPNDAAVDTGGGSTFSCSSAEMLCDDFEGATVSCPSAHPGHWSECEQLGTAPDAVVIAGAPPHDHVLFSSMGPGPDTRAARLAFDMPNDLTTFHAEFDFFPQAGNNTLYTLVKLEQTAGVDANGDPTHFPGISVIVRDGSLALDVQTAGDLSKPDAETTIDLQPAPTAWSRAYLDITFAKTMITVMLQFDDSPVMTFPAFTRGTATVKTTQFLLGIYTDLTGSAAVMYDNVKVRAAHGSMVLTQSD